MLNISNRKRFLIRGIVLSSLFASLAVLAAEQEKGKSWSGNWNNRKYKTEGPLTCTAAPKDEKNWEATFDGKGLGKPFEYKVTFEATKKGERTLLKGTSRIDGDTYQWTGFIEKGVLQGRYRSATGNNGEFTLKETKKQNSRGQD